jgi:hypothetical protein
MIEGSLSLVEHSKNVILVGFFEMPAFSTIQHQIADQPSKNGAGIYGTSAVVHSILSNNE